MPRRFRDYGVAAAALVLLFATLTQVDSRVPAQIGRAMSDVASGRWSAPGSVLGDVMYELTGSTAMDNVFMGGMVAAAVVLLVLMTRT